MRAECYVLDIYCDVDPCSDFGLRESEQYTGRNRAEARKKARADGWIIGKKDVCGSCAKPKPEAQ